MMSTSQSLTYDGNVVLLFVLGVGMTVCFAYVCFSLTVVGVCFSRLAGGVALQPHSLILISSSEYMDINVVGSSSDSDSWTPSNVSFLSNFDKKKCVFAVMSSKICKFFALITLFYFSMWTP